MTTVLRIVGGALSIYMVLLFVRILLTWFSRPPGGKAVYYLHRATEPYLSVFRRFSFLRTGGIDFSPIAAIITLVIVLNIVNMLAAYGRITLAVVLSLIVSALGSALTFIIGFFLVLTALRLVATAFGASSIHPFWQTIDVVINPLLAFIQRHVLRGRQVSYRTGLAISAATIFVVFLFARFLVRQLAGLMLMIPF